MTELGRAKARYRKAADDARRQVAANLHPVLGDGFTLGRWGPKAREAYLDQWGEGDWDWDEIFDRYNAPDRLEIVVWAGEVLCALGLATTTNQAVVVQFVQGTLIQIAPFWALAR